MRRARISAVLLATATSLLALAPAALASAGGAGWYGPTTDQTITTAMFLVIVFFPLVIVIFSLIQWRLDRRKHARMDAAKRRAASAEWRGGW